MADNAVVPHASAQLGEKRYRNFSDEEMEALVLAVGRNYPALYGDNVNSTSREDHNTLWERIIAEVNKVRGATRTKECLLHKYHQLRGEVKSKIANNAVSGEQLELSYIEKEVAKYISPASEHDFCVYTRRTRSGAVMTDLIKEDKITIDNLGRKNSEGRLSFQIFPDPCDSFEEQIKMRDRLPSIVVEPTELAEVESGELRWPPKEFQVLDEANVESEEQEHLVFKQCVGKERENTTDPTPKEATDVPSASSTEQM